MVQTAWPDGGMKLDFANGMMVTHGNVSELHRSRSGHPCIRLLEYPEKNVETVKVDFQTETDEDDESDRWSTNSDESE